MSNKLDDPLQPGDQVRLPTGRPAVVRSVDMRRGEVTVEALPWSASFRPQHLQRVAGPACEVVILDISAPKGEGETP